MIQKTTLRSEIIGGLTTFFTMMYIVVVNPSILSTPGTGMSFAGVMTATVMLCFSMTLLMGLYAKLPFAVGPGMGINAFFTFNLILGKHIPWQIALGTVFWAGVLFLVLSLGSIRERVAQSIPQSLRTASSAGIGLFLTFIGLKNMGLVVADPVTFVTVGPLKTTTLLSIAGLLLAAIGLRRKNPFALLIPIVLITTASFFMGFITPPTSLVSMPDFHSTFFQVDIWGALKLSLAPAIFALCFTDFFDSVATLMGVATAGGIVDEKGNPKNLRQGLVVDAWATLRAGVFGTSSGTAFIESSAGIEAGARTGLASVVTALCFLPLLFLSPLAGLVPAYATAPILVIVGGLMFRGIRELSTESIEDYVPAYLTLILIPLTFSITQGILWGFLSHVILYVLCGRRRDLNRTLVVVAFICGVLLMVEH